MKALPMLDHVMLWVARVFIILAFIATVIDSFAPNPVTAKFFVLSLAVLWLVSIWQFKRPVCRYILGFSSFFFLIYFPLSHPFFPISLHYCIPMTGLIAIFWTALRGASTQKSGVSPNPVNLVNPV
jgi:hypothetical protein